MVKSLLIDVSRQGLHDITHQVHQLVVSTGVVEGLCTLFIQHTSASLVIQENYDASARHDLEAWMIRLVPEGDGLFTHTTEGPDDMPAHIRSALTATSLSIPVLEGRIALGTWQGVFLWEHRHHSGQRRLLAHVSE